MFRGLFAAVALTALVGCGAGMDETDMGEEEVTGVSVLQPGEDPDLRTVDQEVRAPDCVIWEALSNSAGRIINFCPRDKRIQIVVDDGPDSSCFNLGSGEMVRSYKWRVWWAPTSKFAGLRRC